MAKHKRTPPKKVKPRATKKSRHKAKSKSSRAVDPKSRANSKSPVLVTATTARQVWKQLQKSGGLDVSGYDTSFVEALFAKFGQPKVPRSPAQWFDDHGISIEDLINKFLETAKPYAEMLGDCYRFLEQSGVRRTNQAMKVRFDFGKKNKDLIFDLEWFKEMQLRAAQQEVIRPQKLIDQDQAWPLRSAAALGNFELPLPVEMTTLGDLRDRNRQWPGALPPAPTCGNPGHDKLLRALWSLWDDMVRRTREISDSHNELMRITQDTQEDDQKTLRWLTSDFWYDYFGRALYYFADKLRESPNDTDVEAGLRNVQEILNKLPMKEIRETVTVEILEEFLNLPFWKYRHELYGIWVLSQICDAVKGFAVRVHRKNGELIFRFAETHIATIRGYDADLLLISELRTPLFKPEGKSRRSGIQPDYRVVQVPVNDVDNTLIVVECKQYKKGSRSNFAAACNDYARGAPNAKVFLVNYGTVPGTLHEAIKAPYRDRCYAFADTTPKSVNAGCLKKEINSLVGELSPLVLTDAKYEVVVDVSASMSESLSADRLQYLMEPFAMSRVKRFHAIDDSLRNSWDSFDSMLQELPHLAFNGDTDLPHGLQQVDVAPEAILIVTDAEGIATLSGTEWIRSRIVCCPT